MNNQVMKIISFVMVSFSLLVQTNTLAQTENQDGMWIIPAEAISNPDLDDAYNAQIAFDCKGNAFAVWRQYDDVNSTGTSRIYANRYDGATEKWQDPSTTPTLSDSDLGDATDPQIAFDCNGNAFVVWEQYDSGRTGPSQIYANRYDVSTGKWQDPSATTTLSDPDLGTASYPQIAVNCNGNAFAVWQQGSIPQIYAKRYNATSGWTITTTLSNSALGAAGFPQIAFDCNGNAFAVWSQFETAPVGPPVIIYTNRYDASTEKWQDPSATTTLSNPNLGSAQLAEIVFDCNGNAFAVWQQYDSGSTSTTRIYANRYDVSTGKWQDSSATTTLSDPDLGDAKNPQIAFDCNGNAFAVWFQFKGPDPSDQPTRIYANRYDASTEKWQDPSTTTTLSNPELGNAVFSQIAFDCKGNAVVVWGQFGITSKFVLYGLRVLYTRYAAATDTWSPAALVPGQPSPQGVRLPQVAIDCNGNAFVVWPHFVDEEKFVIYAAKRATVPSPPNVRAYQELHRFPTQADLINVLRWDPVSYVNQIVKYKIYCAPYSPTEEVCCATGCFCSPPFCCCGCSSLCADAVLVGEVLGSAPCIFCHHGRCPGQRVTYCISAVDSAGDESFIPATITVP